MKHSKFIQTSKDKFSRSFNPSKCKTSLRLAASRSKLLRNRKENPLKQMRRETAHLLQTGQDQAALIRVEHVIREEKMIAAFELIEIYCELIIARLPVIDSQKNCPNDLREAITSIVFASPRCGDVPELLDVRKQFTAKYGKDFTAAAIELRPTCGVNRLMVEKLSASATDAQTKIKILSAIAEEHNVKWDHKPIEKRDSVPPNDLLGPSTAESASKPYVEPSRYIPDVQAPQSNTLHGSKPNPLCHDSDTKTSPQTDNLTPSQTSSSSSCFQRNESPPHRHGQPYVEPSRYPTDAQAPQINTIHNSQSDSSHQVSKTSPQTENLTPSQASTSSPSFHRKESPPRSQSLTMEFNDAASAAKAAAESAERASMAAKAAAELANDSRIMKQDTSETHKSEVHVSKDEVPESYLITKKTSENIHEERVDSLCAEDTRLQNEKIDGVVEDNLKTSGLVENGYSDLKDYRHSVSVNSKISIEEDLLDHSAPVQDVYSQNDTSKHEAESLNELPEGPEIVREDRVSKQESFMSSRSDFSISDELTTFANPEHPKFDYDADNENFVNGDVVGEDSASVHFDDKLDSGGEDQGFDFGTKYDEPESESHLPLPSHESTGVSSNTNDSNSPEHSSSKSVDSTSSLFTTENSSAEFSENLTPVNDLEQDNLKPVAFDDVDGSISESDEEIIIIESKPNQSGQLNERGSLIEEEDYSGIHKEHLLLSSNHECECMRTTEEKESSADSSEELSSKNSGIDGVEPNDLAEESDTDNAVGLNFGKLTGGLKHKGYNSPLYLKTQLSGSSPPKEENNSSRKTAPESDSDSDSSVEDVSLRKGMGQKMKIEKLGADKEFKTNLDMGNLNSIFGSDNSDCDSSVEDVSLRKGTGQKMKIKKLGEGREFKPNLDMGSLNSIFGSDNSDSDENAPPKNPHPRENPLRIGLSRRTKPSSRNSETSTSKTSLKSEALESDDNMDKMPKSPYVADISKEFELQSEQGTRLRSDALASDDDIDGKPISSNISDIPKELELKNEQETRLRPDAIASNDDIGRKPESPYISDIPEEFELKIEQETQLRSDGLDSDDDFDRKPISSNISDIPEEFQPKNKQEILEQPASPKPAPKPARSNFWGPPEPYVSKISPIKKQETSPKAEETLNKTGSNDDSSKRARHVHPKLPDYDSLIQSLRVNRS